MTTAAVIVAAGRGTRAGDGPPKQWRPLAGRTVADWTIRAFSINPLVDHIVLVMHPEDIDHASDLVLVDGLIIVAGGSTRDQSVLNGLEAISDRGVDKVLIHDVARPCVSQKTIIDVAEALKDTPAAAPAVEITDALWRGENGKVTGTQDRSGLYRAQTPQGFDFRSILRAHRDHPGGALDDVQVARDAGLSVQIIKGNPSNIKITRPEDFAQAEEILKDAMKIRLGNGYDVHAFEDGTSVILCGVEIPHDKALKGHSDADVAMHAVTDAIYGALADGDIGRHFPPSDPQWKGAASEIFLKHAVKRAAEKGFGISNIDVTLICEQPKIGPHASAMRANMANIMGIELDQVSVKATTSEQLGFTGRSEGIASVATAALIGL